MTQQELLACDPLSQLVKNVLRLQRTVGLGDLCFIVSCLQLRHNLHTLCLCCALGKPGSLPAESTALKNMLISAVQVAVVQT